MSEIPRTDPNPKLRWHQYRLWHLFVLMTLAAIGCSWFACRMVEADKQKEAVEAIWELRGSAMYDYKVDASGAWNSFAEPPGPAWFRNLVGMDFLANVVWVNLEGTQVTDTGLANLEGLTGLKRLGLWDTQVTDDGLANLKRLTSLEKLFLEGTRITDAGLVNLKNMTKLEWLSLEDTQITNAGLASLKGLTQLKCLDLRYTQVTNKGVEKLQQALPDCKIHH